ncbi:MAG: hypothetical protein EHM57_01220, partial [Actinobacteria bacterium]
MSRTRGQIAGAAVTGAVIGALGGSAFAAALWPGSGAVGAVVCGAIAAGVAAVADLRRRPGEVQPLTVRILFAAMIAAAAGAAMEWLFPDWSAVVPAVAVGLVSGLSGGRLLKMALGIAVGTIVGIGFDAWAPEAGWAAATAVTVVAYRVIAALVWRGKEQLRVRAEQLPPEQVRFVVPFAESSGYVGVDYLRRYAESVGASFQHAPMDVGIVASLDDLAGPRFDPAMVHPLVREFYEHTGRFHLMIVPEWRWWMRLPYRIYRETIARPLGQANAPFEIEEVQRGVVSWIDV